MAARGAKDRTTGGRSTDATGRSGGRGHRAVPARPARRRRTGGAVVTALGALVALLVLLVGVPALLLYGTLAVADMGGPVEGGVIAALTSPDDGRLFLWALVAVGWLAWLCFAFSVLVEIPAQLRGRVARRLPAFGWSQRIAAGLVGSVLALVPVAGSAFAATERVQIAPATAPALPAGTTAYAALPAAAPATAPTAEQQPGYTVRDTRPADSLWSIAERQLGSGERWVEIAKLNDGRAMDGSGTRFDADRPIQPGWRLLMPADAKPDTGAGGGPGGGAAPAESTTGGASAGSAPAHATVTVHQGDTLSAIAQRELGDAERWPQIFDANKGVRAPDGERLTDPDVVVPGMVLSLPGAPAQAPAPTTDPAPATEPAPTPPPGAEQQPTPPPGPAPAGTAPAPAASAPASAPASAGPVAPVEHTAPAADQHAEAPSDDYTVAFAASTVGVLLAAVLIGSVARRRTDQLRARRPRHRITMPAPAAARFEAELKARQDIDGLELLNRALRTLSRNTVRGGKKLPALVAARITTGRTVELHLAAPAVPIAPFRAAHAANVWWCPDDASDLLSAGQAAKYPAPYPALVTLGCSPDGSVVLADLETVRLVHLSGHPDDAEDVLRTLAVELAHSPLADRLHLHLVGVAADLPGSGPAADRVHHHPTIESALAALGPRTAKARATLIGADATSPRDARSRGHADESWIPEIVLCAQPPSGTVPAELGRLLDGRPRTCLAVVTRAPERGSGPVARWTLPATGPAQLPGLHLTVELQRLDREQYDHLGELVRSSGDFTQHPAPEWTLDGPGADEDDDLVPTELPLPVPVLAAVAASGPAGGAGGDEAATRLLARVIATGASPFAGTAPTVTPSPDAPAATTAPRHSINGLGLHAVSPVHPPATNPYGRGPAALPSGTAPAAPAQPAATGRRPEDAAAAGRAADLAGPDRLPPAAATAGPFAPVEPGAAGPEPSLPGSPVAQPGASVSWGPEAAPGQGAAGPEPSLPGSPVAQPGAFGPSIAAEAEPSSTAPLPQAPYAAAAELPVASRAPYTTPDAADQPAAVPLPQAAPHAAAAQQSPAFPAPEAAQPTAPFAGPAAGGAEASLSPAAPPARVVPGETEVPPVADGEPAPTHDQVPAPDAHGPAAAPTRPAPRPDTGPARTDSDDLLAILRSSEAHAARTAPRIRVLGPVDVLSAAGQVEPAAAVRLTELAAYLALRPGTEHVALDHDLHPGAAHLDPRATAERLADPLPAKLAALSRWLGTAADGRPFLPIDHAAPAGRPDPVAAYALVPTVSCDWDEFRSLYRRGMRSTSATADAALAHALALVRGAPFAEAPAGAYGWAESERQDMLAAIVDTAHELAARRLQYGDHRTAEAAIFRALAVAPDVELLHRDLFYAYASAGARDQLVRAVNRLDALSRRTGRDLDPDTVALLRDLLTGA
ncbi:BTAD domain-containing putative transcriptional regulator [Kitasatospora terrestris]|uniref:LysM domain-containing protein n=1 Tax=Kitasatospora terrestris TaxID=258051 RepID=A0ABP9EA11_9ACTN